MNRTFGIGIKVSNDVNKVEPENVVAAFLNIAYTNYNKTYNRYESYSSTDDLYVWYNYYSADKTKIMVITAFRI